MQKRAEPDPKQVNNHDRTVGAQLRLIRLQHDMSQGELGDRLGVSFQQIQKYEKGTNRLSLTRATQIAELFGVDLHRLSAQKSMPQSKVPLLDKRSLDLMTEFEKLEPRFRTPLLRLIEELNGKK
jgi:transcriptional regulator with XRE-family HTH domain